MASRRRPLTAASRGRRALASSIDGALVLGLALGSMAVSRRRRDADGNPALVEAGGESTDEGGHPNGSAAPVEAASESTDDGGDAGTPEGVEAASESHAENGHPNGPAAPVEAASESTDEGEHPNGTSAAAEAPSAAAQAERMGPPWKRQAQILVVAGGLTIEVLEGCGRSPGFLLTDLSVRDAESGARIGLGQATARTLLERTPQLAWSEAVRWQSGRAEQARRTRIAEGRRRIEAEYQDADAAERQRALTALFRENSPGAPWRLPLLSLGPAALLWLLRRRVKALFPETVAVHERPEQKRPDAKERVGLSAGKMRALQIGLRAVRTMGVRRSIHALRQARRAQQQARRAERTVKAGRRGARRVVAS